MADLYARKGCKEANPTVKNLGIVNDLVIQENCLETGAQLGDRLFLFQRYRELSPAGLFWIVECRAFALVLRSTEK